MDMIEFWTICSANSIILDKEQIRSIERYRNEMLYWNEKVNMISRKDTENILERHVLHSLSILKYVEIPQRAKCLDVGTGGGFPGLPIKIARPDLHVILVDSIAKKFKMVEMFANHTGLKNVKAIRARVEELTDKRDYYQYFDFIFTRAVGKISEILDWTRKLPKKNAKFVFLKGGDLTDEIKEAKQNHQKLVIKEQNLSLFGIDWFEKEEKKLIICHYE